MPPAITPTKLAKMKTENNKIKLGLSAITPKEKINRAPKTRIVKPPAQINNLYDCKTDK